MKLRSVQQIKSVKRRWAFRRTMRAAFKIELLFDGYSLATSSMPPDSASGSLARMPAVNTTSTAGGSGLINR